MRNSEDKYIDYSQEIFNNIMKCCQDEIILCDENFNITNKNYRFTSPEIFGISNFINFVETFANKSACEYIETFKEAKEKSLEIKLALKKDENTIPLSINMNKLFDKKGKLKGFLICISDITSEVKTQILKDGFIATLKHDLRTPILAQITALKLILENKFGEISAIQKDILSEILSSCIFMNSITDNLLSKYNENYRNKNKTKIVCNIAKIVEETCEYLKYMIVQKKQTINFKIKSNEIPTIIANKKDIERLISNLIINASDYGSEGCQIYINAEATKNNIKLSIRYFGNSNNKEDLKDIFNEQINRSDRYQKIAHGLNLYISKQIVEAYGGIITLKYDDAKELTISVCIPKKSFNYTQNQNDYQKYLSL